MPPYAARTSKSRSVRRSYPKRARNYGMGRKRGMALARGALAARIHSFKRCTEAFGFRSGLIGAASVITHVNTGNGTAGFLLQTANESASQFAPGTYQFGGSLQFMLAHVANVSEITQLFDNYRIKAVVVNIIPGFNSADFDGGSATSNSSINIPTMHYTVDTDDATVPNNRVGVLEQSYSQSRRLDKPFSIMIKPRAQAVINSTALGTAVGGMLPTGTWLDNSRTDVPHFGLKFWVDEWAAVASPGMDANYLKFTVDYYLEAKNVV